MNDPHVVCLFYRMPDESKKLYVDPPTVELETEGFSVLLAKGLLIASMKEHHATVEGARATVEPFLRAWEISTGLMYGPHSLVFTFVPPAEIIDRNPPSPPRDRVYTGTVNLITGATTLTATATILRRPYPTPPKDFVASPDVQTMWFRFGLYHDGKEPLLSMAYACLTLLEGSTGATKGSRTAVCRMYSIDQAVRDKLGDIVSERGGPTEARKFGGTATLSPLTDQEKEWIKAVVKALIRRKAEYDAAPSAQAVRIKTST